MQSHCSSPLLTLISGLHSNSYVRVHVNLPLNILANAFRSFPTTSFCLCSCLPLIWSFKWSDVDRLNRLDLLLERDHWQVMESGDEALSLETVIIVACVCGSVVFILTLVLIVLCCRRRRVKCQSVLSHTSQLISLHWIIDFILKWTYVKILEFLQRGRIACSAERCISHGNSVRPSVCPSVIRWYLSRRMNVGLRGLHYEVAKTF